MLRDFAYKTRFVGQTPERITELLGPSECYADYEDQPCYNVIVSGAENTLVFHVAHSGTNSGFVLRATLQESGTGMLGCFF